MSSSYIHRHCYQSGGLWWEGWIVVSHISDDIFQSLAALESHQRLMMNHGLTVAHT